MHSGPKTRFTLQSRVKSDSFCNSTAADLIKSCRKLSNLTLHVGTNRVQDSGETCPTRADRKEGELSNPRGCGPPSVASSIPPKSLLKSPWQQSSLFAYQWLKSTRRQNRDGEIYWRPEKEDQRNTKANTNMISFFSPDLCGNIWPEENVTRPGKKKNPQSPSAFRQNLQSEQWWMMEKTLTLHPLHCEYCKLPTWDSWHWLVAPLCLIKFKQFASY